MSYLIILFVVIYAISRISKTDKPRRRGNEPRQEYRPQQEYYPPQQEEPEICLHGRPETFEPAAPFKEAYSGSLNYASTEGEGTESVPCSLTGHDHPNVHADAHHDVHSDVHSGIHSPEEPVSRPFLSAADRDSCRRAIVYSEILGRPKALRR